MKNKKQWLILAFSLCLTSGVFAQEKDWARFNRYAEANKSVKTPSKVVFMGNSITDGWWPADSMFFIKNDYIDRGIGGQTTAEMLVRFRADVIQLKPQAVVILAGTNDIAQNIGYISQENIFGNIVSMAELAKANNIHVILCSILPVYDYPWRKGLEPANKIIQLNGWLKEYAAQNGLSYVDYHSALKDERNGLPEKYARDGVHPNLEAYKIMEALVQEALVKVIK
ncbi:acylhydrolase [Parabacteroides sp. 52]|uniref:SGNH/GDSL hydrolase family protein n=1 Tax=unclassified Parabacteroides TaxID=2649774 RepID=UPI0013D2E751|nr:MULTISPECIES: SGNH/GDSL hydrolase family protein [unclassified Parabacteroides]MDH6533430.1 lysophospholipase L1-like esterase [Parabacteroides sp. PM5-20]NDV54187.1 acylhydrolase [Parabacteroides sp. 52]